VSEVRFEGWAFGPSLENERLKLTVHLNRGTFDLTEAGSERRVIHDAATSVTLTGGHTFSTRGSGFELAGTMPVADVHGRGMALRLRREQDEGEPEITVSLALYDDDQAFALISSEFRNSTRAPMEIASFQVLDEAKVDLRSPQNDWRFYKHGWQSWSPTLTLPCSGEDIAVGPPVIAPGTRPQKRDGRFVSEMVTVVVDPSTNQGMLAGFITTADQFSQVWFDREPGSMTATSYADGIAVPPGEKLSSERLLLLPGAEPLCALERYGDALGRQMQALPYEEVASGWCSWYYYWHGVREEQIIANLEMLSERRSELPVSFVQIDDGYQAGIGDWLTVNDKFPHGMRWLVDLIHERGFKAGLWLAPFLIGANSRLYAEHPDWAVQYRPGKPSIVLQNWGQDCYALDLTRPDVIAWIENLFAVICEEWGFDYVKIDFIYGGAVDGLRHDSNVTRAQAYRRGLATIRRAVGDRFVLGCGNPIGPSIGLIDGSRIGPDVMPYWQPVRRPGDAEHSPMSEPSCVNSIRNSITRSWMHGRLWMNDPDCLLVRDSETALTLEELRSLATVIGMTGGMVLDGDDLTRLPDERRRIISMLLPVFGQTAKPLDLLASEMPSLLELDCGTHRLLAVFNWGDAPVEVRVALPQEPTHVFEVWEREYAGMRSGALSLSVPAHGCRLLSVRRAVDRPQVVGSTFHLLQGACELAGEAWDGETLRLALRPVACREGELFVQLPEGWGSPVAGCAQTVKITDCGDGLWTLQLRLEQPLGITVTSQDKGGCG